MRGLLARFIGVAAKEARGTSPPAGVAEILRTASAHLEGGRVQAAEAAFRKALALDPGAFDALFTLGLIHHQSGRTQDAIRLLTDATAIRPGHARAHAVLALSYQATNQWSLAEAAIRKAVACNPDWDAARNVLGVVLLQAGDKAGARAEFERALALDAKNVEALNNLANLRKEAGDLETAVTLYRRALHVLPNWSPALINLGLVLYQQKRFHEAEGCFSLVLAREPNHADALLNLGVVKQQRGDAVAAERCFRAALAVNPNFAAARCNLAALLLETGRIAEAAAETNAALALDAVDADILNVSALVHKAQGRLAVAESAARTGLRRNPRHGPLHLTLGAILNARGALDEAELYFNDVPAGDPHYASARYNLGTLALLRGDYVRGFELYENRFDAFRLASTDAHVLLARLTQERRWHGEPLEGRDLLVWAEQGYGDAIMMTRYLPLLKPAGAGRVTVLCEPPLERLMAAVPGVDAVVVDVDLASMDTKGLHCPIMSLPRVMRTRHDAVPPPCTLRIPDGLVNAWRQRLAALKSPVVGLCWRGSAKLRDDAQRSISLDAMGPLLEADVGFVSLLKQPDEAADSMQTAGMFDPMPECHDFMDTAALIHNLDLVISVDTAVAHLAGTLGKSVWLLSRFESEWRWGLASERSVWYPTLRNFRQRTRDDWRETLEQVAAALKQYAVDRR